MNPKPLTIAEQVGLGVFYQGLTGGVSGYNIAADRAGFKPLKQLRKWDSGITPAIYEHMVEVNPALAQQYWRADKQSGGAQLWNGFWANLAGVGTKVGAGLGYAIGALGTPFTQDTATIWDNAMSKVFNDLEESIKESLPVYQSKNYTEGGWMRKMGTTSFWATDGFDGVAFLASAYVPSLALGKVGSLSKALKAVDGGSTLAKGSRAFGNTLAGVSEATGVNTPIALTTLYNTVTEAGFEAHDVNKAIREQLANQMGFASFEAAPEEAKNSIRDKSAEAAARTFWWNSAALLGSNLVQSKWFLGHKSITPEQVQRMTRNGQLPKNAAVMSKRDYLKNFAKSAASEGLWEENIQTSVQQWESRFAKGIEDPDSNISGPLAGALRNAWSFAKALGTLGVMAPQIGSDEDEAGSAIALGALLGGGMSLYQTRMEANTINKYAREFQSYWEKIQKLNAVSGNLLLKDITTPLKQHGTRTIKDEEGKDVTVPNYIDPATNKPVEDPAAYINLMRRMASNQQLASEFDASYATGDSVWAENTLQHALMAHVWRLASSGMSREDLSAVLKEEFKLRGEEAKQLGLEDVFEQNMASMERYADLYYSTAAEGSKGVVNSENELDVSFGNFMHRNLFYLQGKKEILSKFDPTIKGVQELLDEVDDVLTNMMSSKEKVRELYDLEVAPLLAYEKELLSLSKEASKKLDDDTLEKLKEELKLATDEDSKEAIRKKMSPLSSEREEEIAKRQAELEYLIEEIQDIYGTQYLDYGEEARQAGIRAPLVSKSFKVGVPHLAARTSPSRAEQIEYARGKAIETQQALKAAWEAFSTGVKAVGDPGFAEAINKEDLIEDLIEALEQLTSATDVERGIHENAKNHFHLETEKLKVRAQHAQTAVDNSNFSDTEEQLREDLFDDLEETAFLEEALQAYPDMDYKTALLNHTADVQAELEKAATYLARLNNIRLVEDADARPTTWQALVREYAEEQLEGAKDYAENALKQGENFYQENEVKFQLRNMQKLKAAFESRTDVEQSLKDPIIAEAKEVIELLTQAFQLALQNKFNRNIIQLVTREFRTSNLRSALLGSSVVETLEELRALPFYNILKSTVTDPTKLAEIEKILLEQNPASQGAIELLAKVIAEGTQKDLFFNHLSSIFEYAINEFAKVRTGATSTSSWQLSHLFDNPRKYTQYFLAVGIPELSPLFTDPSTPFYKLKKSKDFYTFVQDITKITNPATEEVEGLSKEVSAKLWKAIDSLSLALGAQDLLDIVESKVDAKKLLEVEEALAKEFLEEGQITPTVQQTIALRQLIHSLFAPLSSSPNGGGIFSILKGVLGSGKSLVGVKLAVKAWKKLTGADDSSIVAFGHTPVSSKVIHDSLFPESKAAPTTLEIFLQQDLSSVKLVVIDEAMAFSNEAILAIHDKVWKYNETVAEKDRVRVLALGDPSQIIVEDSLELTALGGNMFFATKDTTPLSVIYRTSVSSIVDVVNLFKDNPAIVDTLIPTVSHSLAELQSMSSLDDVYGVHGAGLQQLLELVNKPSTKSRVIIVNNEAEAQKFSGKVPADVDIMTYEQAQSRQWDQVYLYMNAAGQNFKNQPFRTEDFNAAMYTSVGRGRQFVFIANPGLSIKNPIVNAELAKSKDSLDEDIKRNREVYKEEQEQTEAMAAALFDDKAKQAKKEVKEQKKKNVKELGVKEPVANDPEDFTDEFDTEHVGEESQPIPENGEMIAPSSTVVPPPIANKTTENKEGIDVVHSIKFPTTEFRPEKYIKSGDPMKLLVTKSSSSSKAPFFVEVMAQKEDGKWVSVGVMGAEEFTEHPRMAEILEEAKSKTPISIRRDVTGNDWNPAWDAQVVMEGQVANAHGVQYRWFPLDIQGNSLDNALITFYEGYFEHAGGGRGLIPDVPLRKEDGSINWEGLAPYVEVKIFNKRNNKLKNTNFEPQPGVPYLVFREPSVNGGYTSTPQFMRLEPRKLNESDPMHQTLSGFHKALTDLQNILPEELDNALQLGTPQFAAFLKTWRYRYEVENDKVVTKTDNNGIEYLRESKAVNFTEVTDELAAQIVKQLDLIMTEHLMGVSTKPVLYSKEEAKALVEAGEAKSFTKSKKIVSSDPDAKMYMVTDNFDKVVIKKQPSFANGSAQKAFNAVASANKNIEGINIRVEKQRGKNKGTFLSGKSLVTGEINEDNFYAKYRALLLDILDDLIQQLNLDEAIYETLTINPETGQAYSATVLERSIMEIAERVGDKKAVESIKDEREKLRAELSANPVSRDTLKLIIDSTNLRLPINMASFNKLGRDMDQEANRNQIGDMVENRVQQVLPSTVTITGNKKTPAVQPATKAKKQAKPKLPKASPYKGKKDTRTPASPTLEQIDTTQAKTLKEALHIARKYLKNPIYSPLLSVLHDIVDKGQVEFGGLVPVSELPVGWGGRNLVVTTKKNGVYYIVYNPETISFNNEAQVSVLVHEIIHVFTQDAFANSFTAPYPTKTKAMREFAERIEDLQSQFEAALREKGIDPETVYQYSPSPKNAAEFVANLSNPDFIREASAIELNTKKSMWRAILDAINNFLLSLSGKKYEPNIYDATLLALEDLYFNGPVVENVRQEIEEITEESTEQQLQEEERTPDIITETTVSVPEEQTPTQEARVEGVSDVAMDNYTDVRAFSAQVEANEQLTTEQKEDLIGRIEEWVEDGRQNEIDNLIKDYIDAITGDQFAEVTELQEFNLNNKAGRVAFVEHIFNKRLEEKTMLASDVVHLAKKKANIEILHKVLTTDRLNPSLFYLKQLNRIAKNIRTANRLKASLTEDVHKAYFTELIYRYALTAENKATLFKALLKEDLINSQTTTKEIAQVLTDLGYGDVKNEVINNFLKGVDSTINIISNDYSALRGELSDTDKTQIAKLGLAEAKSIAFITNNFTSLDTYKAGRNWMYKALHKLIKENEMSSDLIRSRQDLISDLYIQLTKDLAAAKSAAEITKNPSLQLHFATKAGGLESMLKMYKGSPLLYYMLTEIYPKWTVDLLETAGDTEIASSVVAEGIRNETEEVETVDVNSRQSDSIKEFLSFIVDPESTRKKKIDQEESFFLSNNSTFYLAAKMVQQHLDLNNLDIFDQQLTSINKVEVLSNREQAVLDSIARVVFNVQNTDVARKDLKVWLLEDSMSATKMIIASHKKGEDIQSLTWNQAQSDTENITTRVVIGNFENAYQVAALNTPLLTVAEFNEAIRFARNLNTLRELTNVLGSLTEKSYSIGITETTAGSTVNTSYITASGFGLVKVVTSQLRGFMEAYHDKKGITKLADEPAIRKVIEKLKSRNQETKQEGVKDFLIFVGLDNLVQDAKPGRVKGIDDIIIGFIDRASTAETTDFSIEDFVRDQSSLTSALTKIATSQAASLRQTSIIDARNNKIFTLVPASFAHKTLDWFIQASDSVSDTRVIGTTGEHRYKHSTTPAHLKTQYYSFNPFVAKLGKKKGAKGWSQAIYGYTEHDALKNENSQSVTSFTSESAKQFFTRQFVHGFLDSFQTSGYRFSYKQFTYQPSDSPRIIGVDVKLLNEAEIKDALESMLSQYSALDKQVVADRLKKGQEASLMFIQDLIDAHGGQVSVQQAYDYLVNRAKEVYLPQLIEAQIPVKSDITSIRDRMAQHPEKKFSKWVEQLSELKSVQNKVTVDGRKEYNAEELSKILEPLAVMFYLNNFVNSHFLNELIVGPTQFYGSAPQIIKRFAGVKAPGIVPYVNDINGVKKTAKILILNDAIRGEETIRQLVNNLLPQVSNEYTLEQKAKDIEEAVQFFANFKSTDAQSIMSESRWQNLSQGYGASYNFSNVLKPVYYNIHDIDGTPVPIYAKTSSVRMSSDVTSRFPGLKVISDYMERHGIDEIHFKSGIKVGLPHDVHDLAYLEDANNVPTKGLIDIDNSQYRLQFNPKSKVESKVALFTQLLYFLNILGTNQAAATRVYSALGMLIEESLEDAQKKLVDSGSIIGRVKENLGKNNERLAELMEAGVDINNPILSDKVFTSIMSVFDKSIQKIKFPGSKLVLQSDQWITKGDDPSVTMPAGRGERLRYVKTSYGWAAEVIVPKSLLTEDLRKAIAKGEEVFLTGDYFGLRLPTTEIHSAVPLKVVGMYDNADTNVIIAPFELVYLHGSDFDVDSLFVFRRETFTDSERRLLDLPEDLNYVGYFEQHGKQTFSFEGDKSDVMSRVLQRYKAQLTWLESRMPSEESVSEDAVKVIQQEKDRLEKAFLNIKKKYYKNLIFETILKTITASQNRQRMLTPIVLAAFNDESNPNSLASFLQEQNLWETDESFNLNFAENAYKAHTTVQDGAILTGIFALANKALAYLATAGPGKGKATLKSDYVFQLKVGDTIETFNQLRDRDAETNTLTWQYTDGAVNLAIDNLNEQTLAKLNVNLQTGPAFIAMLGLGVPLKDVGLILKTAPFMQLTKEKPVDKKFYIQNKIKELRDIHGDVKLPVLSREDLIKLAKNNKWDLQKMTVQEQLLLLNALTLAEKTIGVAESMYNTSKFFNILHDYPATLEDIDEWFSSAEEIFNHFDTVFTSIPKTGGTYDSIKAYKNSRKSISFQTSDKYAFSIPELFSSLPHLESSIRGFRFALSTAENKLLKFRPELRTFAKHIFSSMKFRGFGQDKLNYRDILDELEHFILSSLIAERVSDHLPFEGRKKVFTGYTAFVNKLRQDLDKGTLLYNRLKLNQEVAENLFLENLTMNSEKTGNIRIRMANSVSSNRIENAERMQGFMDLKNFYVDDAGVAHYGEDVNNPSIQNRLVDYAIMTGGFKSSQTSFFPYIPPHMYNEVSKRYTSELRKVVQTPQARTRILSAFRAALAFKYADKLPYFTKEDFKDKLTEGKSPEGIYYDFGLPNKLENPTQGKAMEAYPEFVSSILFPNEDLNRYWTETIVYRRINDPMDSIVYYQKLGRKSVSTYTINPDTFSIRRNFNSNYPTIFVKDYSKVEVSQTLLTKYNLKEGDAIILTGYDDPFRISARTLVIENVKNTKDETKFILEGQILPLDTLSEERDRLVISDDDGKAIKNGLSKKYESIIGKFRRAVSTLSQENTTEARALTARQNIGQSLLEISFLRNEMNEMMYNDAVPTWVQTRAEVLSIAQYLDTAMNTLNEAYEVILETAQALFSEEEIQNLITIQDQFAEVEDKPYLKKLTPEFTSIVKEGNQWKTSNDSDYYTHSKTKEQVVRANAKEGPINILRGIPYLKDIQERAQSIVNNRWQDKSEETKLTMKGFKEAMTKKEAMEAVTKQIEQKMARGSIIHKLLHYILTTDPKLQQELQAEVEALMNTLGESSKHYKWLTSSLQGEQGWQRLLRKAGLNIFDKIEPDQMDKVSAEVTIVDNRFLKWGTTADLVFQKINGKFGIREFKTGWGFNDVSARSIFRYGVGPNKTIYQNLRNTAKLQVMIQAFLMKLNNPDIQFDSLEVTWAPSGTHLELYDPFARVEVEDYLNMLQQYLKNERPDVYAQMEKELGEKAFKKLWTPSEYEEAYRFNTKVDLTKADRKARIEGKLEELRLATFFSLREWESESRKDTKESLEKRAKVLFKDIFDELNDIGVKEHEIMDISFLSQLLASNAHQLSGYIQMYDKMLKKGKDKIHRRMTVYRTLFKRKFEPILQDYHRVHGKSPTDYIPFTKGALSFLNSRKLYEWMYVDVVDEHGAVLDRRIRNSAKDWEEAKRLYPEYGEWEARQKFAEWMISVYDSFFLDEKSHYGTAVANRVATYRERIDNFGESHMEKISNIALHNSYRTRKGGQPFKYESGWFPRVQPLREEAGWVFDKAWWKEYFRDNFTIFNEAHFEQELNETEVIPMAYLGNDYIESTGHYSLNAEHQFEKFVSRMLVKEELEDTYAFGKGMLLYLETKRMEGYLLYPRTIEYLEKALESQIRGRRELEVPWLARNSNLFRTANGDIDRVNWTKVIRTIKTSAAAPIMWLKPAAGLANAIFTYIFTLKEAVKNDMLKSGSIGRWTGVDGNELTFGVSDLIKASGIWFDMQKDAMTGNLSTNKAFLLSQHLGYSTRTSMWGRGAYDMLTSRNKLFSSSAMYTFHTFGEEMVTYSVMIAQLLSMKTADGKTLYDHYNVVTKKDAQGTEYQEVEWDGYVRGEVLNPDGTRRQLTDLDDNELRKAYHVYERLHGSYREDEKAYIEYYVWGEIFMQFKRYLPNVLKNVMGSKGRKYAYGQYVEVPAENAYESQFAEVLSETDPVKQKQKTLQWSATVTEGRYRTMAGWLLSYLPKKAALGKTSEQSWVAKNLGVYRNESYEWGALSSGQREGIVDLTITLAMWGFMFLGYMLLFGGGDDRDPLAKYYKRIMRNFVQQASPLETARDLISPSSFVPASVRQSWGLMSSMGELTMSMLFAGMGREDWAYTKEGNLRGMSQIQRHVRFLASAKEITAVAERLFEEGAETSPLRR